MQIADHPHPLAQKAIDSLMRYREQLLAAGFHEPTRVYSRSWRWLFYKPLTNLTAFIVNLKGENDRVENVAMEVCKERRLKGLIIMGGQLSFPNRRLD